MTPTRRMAKRSWLLHAITILGILGAIAGLAHAWPSAERAKVVKVTVLSTMLTDLDGIGEWGFAALVEVDGYRVLFDTGARRETVLHNAEELKVDLAQVTDVVLSHHHTDHTGGAPRVATIARREEPKCLVACPRGPGDLRAAALRGR